MPGERNGPTLSVESANKEVVQRLYAEVFAGGHLELAEELVDADAVDLHDELDRRGPGRMREVATMLRTAFPDQTWDTHRLVAEGDHVAMYSTWSGTNEGPFMGRPPTGRRVSVRHMYLFEVRDGKVVEYAAVRDDLAMVGQLQA